VVLVQFEICNHAVRNRDYRKTFTKNYRDHSGKLGSGLRFWSDRAIPSSETLGVATVMFGSKRRPASTQAVSRKVEGIEPRNQVNRKDDGVRMCGSQHGRHRKGRGGVRFLGVFRPWHA
jgi:hypothetical protein